MTKSEFIDAVAFSIGYDDPATGCLVVPASSDEITGWFEEWQASGLEVWEFAHKKLKGQL
jgi:hypothetical protein